MTTPVIDPAAAVLPPPVPPVPAPVVAPPAPAPAVEPGVIISTEGGAWGIAAGVLLGLSVGAVVVLGAYALSRLLERNAAQQPEHQPAPATVHQFPKREVATK